MRRWVFGRVLFLARKVFGLLRRRLLWDVWDLEGEGIWKLVDGEERWVRMMDIHIW